ncbi:helix-turn-helix domain-containing protein [Alicyclobacillus herbarius]|uniref:helix-turn-helix domain-containing protein n=1 Tax=Alicyclobacillus herbarius TaxID=122960 RepID=UPI00040CCBCD|nr:helix-turn-helix domain-containing protein [Alicyclobacillus herbarius]
MEHTLGSKLRELRMAKGLTQSALGENLVTASMISQIESDRVIPSERLLEQLLQRLDADPEEIRALFKSNENLQRYRQAKTFLENNQPAEARRLLLQVIEDIPAQVRRDKVFTDLAESCLQLGFTDEAIRMLESALAFALEHEDISTSVHDLYQLGQIERGRRRLTAAAMYWQRGSELLMRHPELRMPVAVKLENNLARTYYILGLQEQALFHYQRACQAAEAFQYPRDLAVIHHGLANVLVEIQEFERAQSHTETALAFYRAAGNMRGVHQCLINQAVILRRQGRHKAAIDHLTNCEKQRSLRHDFPRLAKLQLEMAKNQFALGDTEAALTTVQGIRPTSLREPELAIEALLVKAACFTEQNRFEEAASCLDEALQLCDKVEDPLTRLRIWQRQSWLYRKLGRPKAALSAQLQSIHLIRRHFVAVSGPGKPLKRLFPEQ